MKGLIAKKVGMTQIFDESGNLTPVTVIQIEPNVVVAKKTKENCGYDAVVLGLDDMKASKASKAYAGQFKGGKPMNYLCIPHRSFLLPLKRRESVLLEALRELYRHF